MTMIINDQKATSFLKALYDTAEKDQNDVIANAASALAVRFETPKWRGHALSDADIRLIRYAVSTRSSGEEPLQTGRRKTYKRRVSLA